MKGNSGHFSGTSGDIISIGHMLQVTPPNKLGNEWKDTTNPKAKENGSNRTSYTNTIHISYSLLFTRSLMLAR